TVYQSFNMSDIERMESPPPTATQTSRPTCGVLIICYDRLKCSNGAPNFTTE
ncbi:unnamed protein product, partial [Rotaria sordida]